MSTKETIKLAYPVTVSGVEITEISLRRMKARDLKIMESRKGGDLEKSMQLVADLAEMDTAVIDELDAADFATVSETVESFLEKA